MPQNSTALTLWVTNPATLTVSLKDHTGASVGRHTATVTLEIMPQNQTPARARKWLNRAGPDVVYTSSRVRNVIDRDTPPRHTSRSPRWPTEPAEALAAAIADG